MPSPKILVLSENERTQLEALALLDPRADRRVLRARIVLAAASGKTTSQIAQRLSTKERTVNRWRLRFVRQRIEGINALTSRLGRKPRARDQYYHHILRTTREVPPPNGRHWTCRTLASHLGVSVSLVQRVWKMAGIDVETRRKLGRKAPAKPLAPIFPALGVSAAHSTLTMS